MKKALEKLANHKISPFIIYGLILFLLMRLSWFRWPDPWVDFGYFLYHAWQVSVGGKLGIDLSYPYGPLAIHFYGLIFRMFGPSIIIVYVVNFAFLLVDIFLIHHLFARRSKYVAFIGTTVFIALFSVGQFLYQGNQNLIAPYKPEVALGTITVLLFISLIFIEKFTPLYMAALGVLFSCLILISTESAIAAILISAVFFTSRWQGWKNLLIFFMATSPIILFFWIYLKNWAVVFNAFYLLKNSAIVFLPLYKQLMGIDRPMQRFFAIFEACGNMVTLAAFFIILGNLKKSKTALTIFSIVLMITFFLFADFTKYWSIAAKPLSVLSLVGIIWWLTDRKRYFFLGIWSAFSLAMMARIFFNPIFHYYGFTLAFPATLLAIYLFGEIFPKFIEQRGYSGNGLRVFIALVVFQLICVSVHIEWPLYRHRNFVINDGKNFLMDWDFGFSRRGLALQELLQYLHENLKPGEVLLGIPDGHIVNYLLKSPRPSPYSLSPADFGNVGESKIIDSFESGRPKFIFSVTDEFYDDRGGYGYSYGLNVKGWVTRNYRPIKNFQDGKAILYLRKKVF